MKKINVEEFLNRVLLYFICFLFCLRLTILYNCKVIYNLLPITVVFSFILVAINYKKFNKEWLKSNLLIVIYLIWCFLLVFANSYIISNLKTFVYETFFLIVVLFLFKKQSKDSIKVMKMIVITNLILNIISVLYQYGIQCNFKRELYGVYTNPNGTANFTVLSLIIYFTVMLKKENKLYNIIYTLFSIVIILLSKSRTPVVVLILYVIARILLHKKIFNLDRIKFIFNVLIIGSILFIIGISYINKNNVYPTKFEQKINDLTTNRYYLWKYSILSLEKSPILGIGESNIGEYRWKQVNREVINSIDSQSRIYRLSMNNNHNGYLQLLIANGYIAFVIFMLILLKKIKKINNDNFYIIATVLVINLFENELILTQSIYIFILMYMLNSKKK